MKIYKVTLDPSNPIQQLVKIPAGSDYGLQILWDYEKFPKFIGTDVDTNNGKLYLDGNVVNTERIKDIDGIPNPANPLDTIYKDGQQTLKIDYNKKLENVGDSVVYKYTNNADSNGLGTIKVIAVDTSTLDYDNEGQTYNFIKETNTAGNQTITIDGIHQVGIKSTYGNILVDGKTGVDIKSSTEGISLTGPSINLNSQNGKINIGSETLSPTIKLNGCTIPETIKNNTGIVYNSDTSTLQWTITGGNINNTNTFLIGEPFLNTYIAVNPTCSAIDINATTLKLNGVNLCDIDDGTTYTSIYEDDYGHNTRIQNDCIALKASTIKLESDCVLINGQPYQPGSGGGYTYIREDSGFIYIGCTKTAINLYGNVFINDQQYQPGTSYTYISEDDTTITIGCSGVTTTKLCGNVYINGQLYQPYTSITECTWLKTTCIENDCVSISTTAEFSVYGNNIHLGSWNKPATLYINGQQYQPGSTYTSICEVGDATLIQNDCVSISTGTSFNVCSGTIHFGSQDEPITFYINGQQYQPGSTYTSITESVYGGDCITTIQTDCIYFGTDGYPAAVYINGTQICLTKFLADYGM